MIERNLKSHLVGEELMRTPEQEPAIMEEQLQQGDGFYLGTATSSQIIDEGKKFFDVLEAELMRSVYATEEERILFGGAIATNGMILFDGVWGVGKTHIAKTLAAATGGTFGRVQGGPGIRDKDVTGYWTVDPKSREAVFVRSALHDNFSLIDEMHRIGEKQQAGFVEGMEEGQVTINNESILLPENRVLVATRNPKDGEIKNVILDRLDYSNNFAKQTAVERAAIRSVLARGHKTQEVLSQDDIAIMKRAVQEVEVGDIENFVDTLIDTTYEHSMIDLEESISGGYRHSASIINLARARAVAKGRYVANRSDVQFAAPRVLQHRIVPSYEADQKKVSSEDIVNASVARHLQRA